jgi:hypothetical protein
MARKRWLGDMSPFGFVGRVVGAAGGSGGFGIFLGNEGDNVLDFILHSDSGSVEFSLLALGYLTVGDGCSVHED